MSNFIGIQEELRPFFINSTNAFNMFPLSPKTMDATKKTDIFVCVPARERPIASYTFSLRWNYFLQSFFSSSERDRNHRDGVWWIRRIFKSFLLPPCRWVFELTATCASTVNGTRPVEARENMAVFVAVLHTDDALESRVVLYVLSLDRRNSMTKHYITTYTSDRMNVTLTLLGI